MAEYCTYLAHCKQFIQVVLLLVGLFERLEKFSFKVLFFRDRGGSVIEGADIHKFGFTNRENNQFKETNEAESEYMNMGPLNYRYSAVPVFRQQK